LRFYVLFDVILLRWGVLRVLFVFIVLMLIWSVGIIQDFGGFVVFGILCYLVVLVVF